MHADPAHRSAASRLGGPDLFLRVLDEIGHGVVVLGPGQRVRYANPAGLRACTEPAGGAIVIVDGDIATRRGADALALQRALRRADAGLRSLLSLGAGDAPTPVAVIPLRGFMDASPDEGILLLLGRRETCESLTVDLFARSQGLTDAEGRVLALLCRGRRPSDMALELGVAISTIRTQLTTVRMKTRTGSLRALVQRVADLPPMSGILGTGGQVRRGFDGDTPARAAATEAGCRAAVANVGNPTVDVARTSSASA